MKKRTPYQLILESLEERVFFDANPAAAIVEPTDGGVEEVTPDGAQMQADSESTVAAQETIGNQLEGGGEQLADGSISIDQNDTLGSEPQEVVETSLDNELASEAGDQDGTSTETETINQDQNVLVEQEATDRSEVDRVVFVDDNIKDFDNLLKGVATDVSQLDESFNVDRLIETRSLLVGDTEIVVLDHKSDELSQISETLANYDELSSVHIFSYGGQNSLTLGDTTLTTSNLDSYSTQITEWGEALSENGDFLLYGCNIAQDVSGNNFIEAFAQLTEADVAASDDQTGNQTIGGDWDLEVSSGEVEATTLQDATGQWSGVLDPAADSTLSADNTQPMINSTFNFEVTFDNTDVDVGYGPFVDVFVPATIDITGGPEYLGQPISHEIYTWDSSAGAWLDTDLNEVDVHPFDSQGIVLNLPAGSDDGDKWYLVEHSFGSFTPDQPIATITFDAITSVSAQVGVGVDITSQAGFRSGDTATNDNGPLQEGVTNTLTITPQVIDIQKSNDAPEDQTVTGPNYPVGYTLTVNVAAGETVDNVVVRDYLPENAVYRGDVTITPINGAAAFAGSSTEPVDFVILGADIADRLLEINFDSITGVASAIDGTSEYQITYTVYFSDLQSDDSSTLLSQTGDDVNDVLNEASVTGTYNTLTVSDGIDVGADLNNLNGNDNDTNSDNQIQLASLVTYKDVTVIGGGDPAPGEFLEWRIEVNISDYYTADNIVLNDVFGDGQTYDATFTPTLEVYENGTTNSYTFDGANFTVGVEDAFNDVGDTELTFDVSAQLTTETGESTLEGGIIADGTTASADDDLDTLNGRIGGDGTRFFVVYRTVIDQEYDEFHTDNSNDASVDIGDEIHNRVTVNADITDGTNTEAQEDNSADSVVFTGGDVEKTIYAVNGDTGYDLSRGVQVGDVVTYRLKMELPSADFENLVVRDFLPLPIYDVGELTASIADDFLTTNPGTGTESGVRTFSGGEIAFGPEHNLNNSYITGLAINEGADDVTSFLSLHPTEVTVDSTNNSIELDFGSYDATASTGAVIDILLTLTINNEPMVDGLRLTNLGEWSVNDTNQSPEVEVGIQQVIMNTPEVEIIKGVVAIDNPNGILDAGSQGPLTFNGDGTITLPSGGMVEAADLIANPVDANLTDADGGDVVTFALTIYNTGGDDAFDINVTDQLPTGFVTPANVGALNIHVYQGSSETEMNGALYSASLNGAADTLTINFEDVALVGDPENRENGGGDDVFIVTYQLTVDNETVTDADVVSAGSAHTNTATVDFFTGTDNSTVDWTETLGDPTDDAEVVIVEPTVVKTLVGTEITDTTNANNEAVIGEIVTYQVVLTLPEGMTEGAVLIDQLDPGLTFVELVSVTPLSNGLPTTDLSTTRGDTSFNLSNFTPTISGDWVNIDLGSITNINDNNAVAETVTFVYTAFVSNDIANQSGVDLNNSAQLTFTGGDGTSNISSAENVTVIEPELEVIKTVDVDGNTSGDAGDPVTYTIVIRHHTDSETTAYDTDFSDQIPDEIIGATLASVIDSEGTLLTTDFTLTGGNLLTLNGTIDMLENRTISLTVTGTLAADLPPEQTITNDATVTWQSLDNDPPHDNDGTDERTGSDGVGGLNDYSASDNADIDIFAVGITKTLIDTEFSEDGGVTDLINDDPALNERLEATIGEKVTYEVVLTIPEGELNTAQLVDLLDTGLQFDQIISSTVSTGLNTTTNPITASVSGTGATGDQQTIIFDLGTVTHSGSEENDTEETVTIRYTAIVLNDVANFEGRSNVDNAATLIWDAGSGPGTGSSVTVDAEDLTIIEPWIETVKTVNQTTGVEAGDTLTYTVSLTNAGHAAAYEVNFHDILAPGTTFGAIATATIGGTNIFAGSNATTNADDSITFTNDAWDLLVGQTLIVTYTVDVTSDAVVHGSHTNTVEADWSNLDGADTDERVYDEDDGIDSPVDDGANADRDVDTATFAMDAVTITKSDNDVTTATIGDQITYTLSLNSPRGTVSNMVIEDLLPQGLIFNNDATISTATGSYTIEATHTEDAAFGFNDGSALVTITWDLGDTIIDTDSPIIIEYTATVANVVSNSNETVLSNAASIEYDNAMGGHETPPPVSDDLEIVEPVVSTMKVIAGTADGATATVEVDDIVEYTVTLSNTGDAGAYEITAVDTLADGTSYFTDALHSPSATIGGFDAGINITDNGTTLSITSTADGWDLAVDESVVITYYAKVGSSYMDSASGNNTENTVDADWSNREGVVAGERIYDDGDAHPLQTVDGDQDTDPADFDVLHTGSIGDLVFYDGDANGNFSAGDVGILGVDVILTADVDGDGTSDYTQTVTTDINGNYLFSNLAAFSDYVITVDESTLPSEVQQTYDPGGAGSLDGEHTLALAAGQNIDTVDFGYTGENDGSLGDYVWYDLNMNGLQDEVGLGIEGAEVTLHGDLDGNGIYEYTATATTNSDGFYQFVNLPLEDYWVEVSSLPIDLVNETYERDGSLDNRVDIADIDWNLADPSTQDLDFGFVGAGSIGNYIWNNLNGDNAQDLSESGLANITVTLTGDFDNDGTNETLTTVTDFNGLYYFNNLPSGVFSIMVDESTLPESFVITSDPDATSDSISTVTLGASETNNDQDFGYTETGSIGDTVFFDLNNNGIEDIGDMGIPGVEVVLVGDVDLDGDQDTVTVITDNNGNYFFDGLLPGNYSITVTSSTLPDGMNQTYDLDGLISPDTSDVSIVAGEDKLDVDFGYVGTGSIGDTVWYDLDDDGVVDPGEEGIGGVKITLEGDFDGDGVTDMVLETTTDANGNYSFGNLFAGQYIITSDPSTITDNYYPVYDADGTLDNVTTVELGAGEVNNNVDFGYRPIPVPPEPSTPLPVTPSPEIATPYDPLFQSYVENGDKSDVQEFIEMRRDESVFAEPLLPVSPIYTGHAEPGTTLYINLTDAQGNLVGSQLVMADTGGNWLANFSGTLLYDMPHNIEIQQDLSLYNASSAGGFNLRTYFIPAFSSSPFTTPELTIDSIFATQSFAILESLGEHFKQSGNLAWNDFYEYEFKAVSTNPSQSTL